MALLDAYKQVREFVVDPRSITVTQKLASGDLSDAITDAKIISQRELQRTFAPASLTSQSRGYVIWLSSLTNVTDINPGDEITDGSVTIIIRDVVDGHFDDAKQFAVTGVPKVSEG